MEIERRFLLDRVPDEVMSQAGDRIVQGYLVNEEGREIRLRQSGKSRHLTVKDGTGVVRGEVEIVLTLPQFDELWPLTEGRRITKVRRRFTLGRHLVEVDNFEPPHSPLVLAEIEFEDLDAARSFSPPEAFGREVTDHPEYRNSWIASHGLPGPHGEGIQAGTIPFLMRGGRLHIVLVTNSSQSAWIVPKGNTEDGMSRHEAALMEAAEEAGVLGSLIPGMKSTCHLTSGRHLVLFAQRVTTLLNRWPEASVRKRRVVPLDRGLSMISDPGLKSCIERLAQRYQSRD